MPEPSPRGRGAKEAETPEARARTRALRLLARREKSRRGIEQMLRRAGHSGEVVRQVVDELEAQGLVDDARFCRLYLGQQVRFRPRSLRILRRDLAREGIGRALSARIFAEMAEELDEDALAEAAARKKLRAAGSDPERLRRLLAARGFGRETTEVALRKVLGEGNG